MPVWARRRMRRRRLNSATTPCCSTTAIAKAADPVAMANGVSPQGVEAGRTAFEAGLMEARDFASPFHPSHRGPRSGMPYPDRNAYPDRFYPVVDSVAWVARLAAAWRRHHSTARQGAQRFATGLADGQRRARGDQKARRQNWWSTITGAQRSSPARSTLHLGQEDPC